MKIFNNKLSAFSLAEVLIVISVIGIVATLTITNLIAEINERVNTTREVNIVNKVTKAMDKMKVMGLLAKNYQNTDAFVDELQKHLKIAKRCDAQHLTDCWSSEIVINSQNERFEVKNAKTGEDLGIDGNKTNNVGLVLADGAQIILTYNENSEPLEAYNLTGGISKSLPVGNGKMEDFAYTTTSTSQIAFVMDVNGGSGPNKEVRDNIYYDIRSFNGAGFGKPVGKTLYLDVVGASKVQVIKSVREITGLGLKEAKELVDSAPSVIKEFEKSNDCDNALKKLEANGAVASCK